MWAVGNSGIFDLFVIEANTGRQRGLSESLAMV